MVFPFDVRAAMTTALASRWAGDGGGIRRGRPQIQAPQLFFVPQVQQASAQRGRGETPARQQTGRGLRHGLAAPGADGDRRQPAPLVKQDQPVAHGNRGGVPQAGFPAPHQAAGLHLHAPQAAADRAESIHVAVPADEVVVVAVQHLLVAPPQFLIAAVGPHADAQAAHLIAADQHEVAAHDRRAGVDRVRMVGSKGDLPPHASAGRIQGHKVLVGPDENEAAAVQRGRRGRSAACPIRGSCPQRVARVLVQSHDPGSAWPPPDVHDQPVPVQQRAGADWEHPRFDLVLGVQRPGPARHTAMQVQAVQAAFRAPGVHVVAIERRSTVRPVGVVHSSAVGGGITKSPPRPAGVRPGALNHLDVAVAIEQHQHAAAHHRRGISGPQGTRPTHGRPRVGPLGQHIRLPRHAVVIRPEEPGPARGPSAALAVSRRGGRRRRRHTAPDRHATFGRRCRRAVTTGAGDHQAAQQRPPETDRG